MDSVELQRALAACIAAPEGALPLSPALLTDSDGAANLAVYRRNRIGVLVRALEAAYPACARVLGERCFRALARDYVAEHPSLGPDLNAYGEGLADFIDALAPEPLQALPYLSDLARLEWYWQRAVYAPLSPPFPYQAFAAAVVRTEGRVRLQPGPGVAWLGSSYPLPAIRAANLSQGDAIEIPGLTSAAYWCVQGSAAGPLMHEIERPSYELLNACARGIVVAGLPEVLGESQPAVLQRLTTLIAWDCLSAFSAAATSRPC